MAAGDAWGGVIVGSFGFEDGGEVNGLKGDILCSREKQCLDSRCCEGRTIKHSCLRMKGICLLFALYTMRIAGRRREEFDLDAL